MVTENITRIVIAAIIRGCDTNRIFARDAPRTVCRSNPSPLRCPLRESRNGPHHPPFSTNPTYAAPKQHRLPVARTNRPHHHQGPPCSTLLHTPLAPSEPLGTSCQRRPGPREPLVLDVRKLAVLIRAADGNGSARLQAMSLTRMDEVRQGR